ncbi:MAG: hypothetical protein JNK82_00990 [Myxococcaceae bacterium]|nr:hypothetical protein [Myxococcaceae bacterium]
MSRSKSKASALLPIEVAGRLPSQLHTSFASALPSYEGASVYALPYREVTARRPVHFDPRAAWDIMSTYGENLPQTKTFVPLGVVGKSADECFAVDPSNPELPVFFFEHEAGFHAFAPSLAVFLKRLLKKGEKSPFDKLEKAIEKAEALDEKGKHKELVTLLEPIVDAIPQLKYGDGGADDLARALNFLGCAYRELKREDDAIAVFHRAQALADDTATLNLTSLYEDKKDFSKAIALSANLRARAYGGGDHYEWFWSRNYLGRCSLRVGDIVRATRAYHEIHSVLSRSHPVFMAEAKSGLETVMKEGGRPADHARSILTWFTASPSPANSTATRAWWSALPKPLRDSLAKQARLDPNPTDEALESLVRRERLDLDDAKVGDLSFLSAFLRLDHLRASQHRLTDLSSLPEMPKLERLNVSKGGLESLKGIERAPNLEVLKVDENVLTSIEELARVPRLRELDLDENEKLGSLAPLANHAELKELGLRKTAVTDLTPLEGCRALEKVEFSVSKIVRGLDALRPLERLRVLDGVSWKVPDREVRAFLEAKPHVEIGIDGYRRWPPKTTDHDRAWWKALGTNPQLREAIRKDRADRDEPIDEQLGKLRAEDFFSLSDSNIESIAELATFPNTRFVALERNPVADLSPLGALPRLETIRAPGSKVTSIAGLRSSKRLDELDLEGAPLESLDGAEGLVSVELLDITDSSVSSLEPLKATSALRRLTFSGAPVKSLSPLSSHSRLVHLDCSASKVTDLSPLAANTQLARIECWGNPGLTGLMNLVGLERLNAVFSRGSLPAAEVEAFRKARPDVDVD